MKVFMKVDKIILRVVVVSVVVVVVVMIEYHYNINGNSSSNSHSSNSHSSDRGKLKDAYECSTKRYFEKLEGKK